MHVSYTGFYIRARNRRKSQYFSTCTGSNRVLDKEVIKRDGTGPCDPGSVHRWRALANVGLEDLEQ